MAEVKKQQAGANRAHQAADELLGVVQQLVAEVHPQRSELPISLDSSLDRDLGLDSLARIELLLRAERRFGVSLPEQLIASTETPRDLLRAVLGAEQAGPEPEAHRVSAIRIAEAKGEPVQAATLLDVLEWHADRHPERTHVMFCDQKEQTIEMSYGELLEQAQAVCAGLRAHDLQPGETAAIMLPTGRDFFYSFYGILMAGGTPVPIYPPARLKQIEEHVGRQTGILSNALIRMLITFDEAKPVGRLLKSRVESLREVVTAGDLMRPGGKPERPSVQPQDIAMLQYTSGSTGNPKGVVLSHANLLANIRTMGQAVGVRPDDIFVSWLPLYHDMGLIGAGMGSMYYGVPLILMSPMTFMARPQRWLWAIHEYRATISPAPNFAYEHCLRAIDDADIKGLDLSSWRMALNGAEPVSPDTIERFIQRFSKSGFKREALMPVYGLAENAVGLAFPPPGRGPRIDRIRRAEFERSVKAIPAADEDAHALQFVACGQPLPGHQIRIVDGAGREVAEREEGRLQFKGPSATSGYYRNAVATAELYQDEWLNSGDYAYMAAGEIYLTGRAKDIIIRAGRNIYPQELEDAVGDIQRIRKGSVAAFASPDPKTGTERLIVLAETRERRPERQAELRHEINEVSVDILDTPPDEVVLAPPNTVLKTSSGKIRRAACRQLYERGEIGAQRASVRWQLIRLALAAALPQIRRSWRGLGRLLYGGYVWSLFVLMAILTCMTVAVLPGLGRRRAYVRNSARLFMKLVGISITVHGLENIPADRSAVLVANHASYADGIILYAILPPRLVYIVKRELESRIITRMFMRSTGAEYVDRTDPQRGAADTDHLAEIARQGSTLAIMPEGTFGRAPGLRPFHMGAFMIAVQSQTPVVPVAIRGTRSLLRAGSWFPRRGVVGIVIGKPIVPEGEDWNAAIRLREQARHEILRHCGEPDLRE